MYMDRKRKEGRGERGRETKRERGRKCDKQKGGRYSVDIAAVAVHASSDAHVHDPACN